MMSEHNTYGAVVGYHMNPNTCGVARFNSILARTLSVPFIQLAESKSVPHPLISVKWSELSESDTKSHMVPLVSEGLNFSLFVHDVARRDEDWQVISSASRVFAANSRIASEVRHRCPGVVSAFAPGMLMSLDESPAKVTLITFGMAHKIDSKGYRKLAELLAHNRESCLLEISTALHHGTSFDDDFFSVTDEISRSFDGRVRFVGFLSDIEIAHRLRKATAMVAFFQGGVMENNTTVLAAMASGCAVITNLGVWSPKFMAHGTTVFDIHQMRQFPDQSEVDRVRINARVAVDAFNFDSLAKLLQ